MVRRERLAVTGMACDGCERSVSSALTALDGVRRVDADHESDEVEVVVEDDVDRAALAAAVHDAGYDVPS